MKMQTTTTLTIQLITKQLITTATRELKKNCIVECKAVIQREIWTARPNNTILTISAPVYFGMSLNECKKRKAELESKLKELNEKLARINENKKTLRNKVSL